MTDKTIICSVLVYNKNCTRPIVGDTTTYNTMKRTIKYYTQHLTHINDIKFTFTKDLLKIKFTDGVFIQPINNELYIKIVEDNGKETKEKFWKPFYEDLKV